MALEMPGQQGKWDGCCTWAPGPLGPAEGLHGHPPSWGLHGLSEVVLIITVNYNNENNGNRPNHSLAEWHGDCLKGIIN